MASKRKKRRRECERKKKYDTKEDAWLVARKYTRESRAYIPVAVYKCEHCGGYHVGRKRIRP